MVDKFKANRRKDLNDFKTFAIKGNIMDMAVGVIIGGAFGKIVTSLVNDIVMPVISLATGKIDFTNMFIALDGNKYATLDKAKEAGVATLNFGLFLTTIIDFMIIALSIFIVLRQIGKFNKKEETPPPVAEITEKDCPYCMTKIHINATKCPHCTADLNVERQDDPV